MSAIRQFRAAVSIGLVWGLGWATCGVALVTWRVFLGHPRLAFPLQYWPRMAFGGATILGACGLAAGILFAGALRRHIDATSVESLSLGRSARWGALAGAGAMLALPFLGLTSVVPLVIAGAITCGVGAMSALATLTAARRATALTEPTTSAPLAR